jgi:positive regulator of sigma E activity
MTLETGRVIRTENSQALVEVQKGADCTRCHAGCACNFGKKTVTVKADDPIGVQKDQIVSLVIPEGNCC